MNIFINDLLVIFIMRRTRRHLGLRARTRDMPRVRNVRGKAKRYNPYEHVKVRVDANGKIKSITYHGRQYKTFGTIPSPHSNIMVRQYKSKNQQPPIHVQRPIKLEVGKPLPSWLKI